MKLRLLLRFLFGASGEDGSFQIQPNHCDRDYKRFFEPTLHVYILPLVLMQQRMEKSRLFNLFFILISDIYIPCNVVRVKEKLLEL